MNRVLALALITALILSACNTSSVSGEAARTVAGQVADYRGPAGALSASINGVEADLGTGSVSASGNFTFALEADVPEEALTSISSGACDGLEFSNPDANVLAVTELAVMSEGEVAGYLTLAAEEPGSAASNTVAARIYVDQSATVQGACDVGNVKQTVNLDLERGWNVVSSETVFDETAATLELKIYGGAAADLTWFYTSDVEGGVVTPPDAPDTSNEISGRVQNYSGPEGYLGAALSSAASAGDGFIGADGTFYFGLYQASEDALEPITNLADCEGVVISDRDAGIARFGQITVFAQVDGEVAGALVRTDAPPTGGNEASYTVVGRYYADRDVTAQGQCDSGDRVDLDLERGWNVVTLKVEESANPLGTYTYTSGEPSGVAWYFVPNN